MLEHVIQLLRHIMRSVIHEWMEVLSIPLW